MNSNPSNQKLLSFIGIAGAFLIVAVLAAVMVSKNQPPPLDQKRIAERKAALAEIRAADAKALGTNEVIDPGKGIFRLSIANAMDLTVKEYQNPAAARSNLIARAAKANEAPPKAPEAPNKFE
jgi:hypothetical protein